MGSTELLPKTTSLETINLPNPSVSIAFAELETMYLGQTSLEFRQVMDEAVANLETTRTPTLAAISSSFYAIELLRRCQNPVHIISGSSVNFRGWQAHTAGLSWGQVDFVEKASSEGYQGLLWAEPEGDWASEIADLLYQHALPGATLNVIASTALRSFLPAWQSAVKPAQFPLPINRLVKMLQSSGWQIEQIKGYYGPRAVVWNKLALLFQSVGRLDWTDRAGFAMRASYIEQGLLWKITPLVQIFTRKT